jgi:hypothetical protein
VTDYTEQNKQQASQLLYETDWTTIPDITDPELSTPYLLNQSDYIAYRNQLRQIAVTPPATQVTDWPVKPQSIWST